VAATVLGIVFSDVGHDMGHIDRHHGAHISGGAPGRGDKERQHHRDVRSPVMLLAPYPAGTRHGSSPIDPIGSGRVDHRTNAEQQRQGWMLEQIGA
jgi:hypothetical protein